jgi:hypothetical protein
VTTAWVNITFCQRPSVIILRRSPHSTTITAREVLPRRLGGSASWHILSERRREGEPLRCRLCPDAYDDSTQNAAEDASNMTRRRLIKNSRRRRQYCLPARCQRAG